MCSSRFLARWAVPVLALTASYLSLVLYARANIAFSPFFDQAFLFSRLQALVDNYQVRFPQILSKSWEEAQASEEENFCVAIVSVDRPKPYLLTVLGSLLSGGISPHSLLVYRPQGHDKWLDSLGNLTLLRHNISDEERQAWIQHSPLENLHYISALESACLDKDFLVMLEDDTWVTSNFRSKIVELIRKLNHTKTTHPLGYVKLSFPNNLLDGHLFKSNSLTLYAYTLGWSLPLQLLSLCMGNRKKQSLLGRSLGILALVMLVLLTLGQDTVRSVTWARWSWFTAGRFKGTLGLLFPRPHISEIAQCMRSDPYPGSGTDFALGYCLQDQLNLSTLTYYPHLVQHIGFVSVRTAEALPDGTFLHSSYFWP